MVIFAVDNPRRNKKYMSNVRLLKTILQRFTCKNSELNSKKKKKSDSQVSYSIIIIVSFTVKKSG